MCIPGGTFRMGHPKLPRPVVDATAAYKEMPSNDWAPEHEVELSPYFIDAYEVTWRRYRRCVEAGVCSYSLIKVFPSTQAALFDDALADLPAQGVDRDSAEVFCRWSGKRLPTEAEWERAARGPDSFDYPWGNSPPTVALRDARTFYPPDIESRAFFPAAAGTNVEDVSVDGVHDMFSGVDEWVSDWDDAAYYSRSERVDPQGPAGPVQAVAIHEYGMGNFVGSLGGRMVRGNRWNRAGGAGWDLAALGAPMWFRQPRPTSTGVGLRCARSDTMREAQPLPVRPAVYRSTRWETEPKRVAP